MERQLALRALMAASLLMASLLATQFGLSRGCNDTAPPVFPTTPPAPTDPLVPPTPVMPPIPVIPPPVIPPPLAPSTGTTLTITNRCSFTIWPGVQANGGLPLLENGGFILAPGNSRIISLPPNWGGRFWARTDCVTDAQGLFTCQTGSCGSVLECQGAGGAPPATLAEITLGPTDFYDVSLVDGYNLPVTFSNSKGCTVAGCTTDLNIMCPAALAQLNANGQVVGCRSACATFGNPEYCCTEAFNTPQACAPTEYSTVFKTACPTSYSYAYDDLSSLFTCPAGASYVVTFC